MDVDIGLMLSESHPGSVANAIVDWQTGLIALTGQAGFETSLKKITVSALIHC